MTVIETVECKTARDFLWKIDVLHPRLIESKWVFRGHSNIEWKLLPRAMRTDFFDGFIDKYMPKYLDLDSLNEKTKNHILRLDEVMEQYEKYLYVVLRQVAETQIVNTFFNLADRVGFELPVDGENSWVGESNILDEQIQGKLHGLPLLRYHIPRVKFALAQHHGIPTRLLDWTYNPLIASFFATHIDHEILPTHIALWAVNTKLLKCEGIEIIRHRRRKIGFLHAQDGIFVSDRLAGQRYLQSNKWHSLDEIISEQVNQLCIYKFVLNVSEVDELKYLLAKKEISKPFLMPSFDNVAQEIIAQNVNWLDLITE